MMKWRERIAWLLVTGLAVAGVVIAAHEPAAAARPAPAGVPVLQCPPGQSPACAAWQDQNSGQVVQDLLLQDRNGAPVWWVNNAGGMWVGNDRLGVTGASVFDQAAYLSTSDGSHGVLVVDGQELTGNDISFVICLNRGGSLASCRNGG